MLGGNPRLFIPQGETHSASRKKKANKRGNISQFSMSSRAHKDFLDDRSSSVGCTIKGWEYLQCTSVTRHSWRRGLLGIGCSHDQGGPTRPSLNSCSSKFAEGAVCVRVCVCVCVCVRFVFLAAWQARRKQQRQVWGHQSQIGKRRGKQIGKRKKHSLGKQRKNAGTQAARPKAARGFPTAPCHRSVSR